MTRPRSALAVILLVVTSAAAQRGSAPPPPPPAPAPDMAPATVSYAVDSENRDPARFTLTIDLVGHATYTAEDAVARDQSTKGEEPTAVSPPYRSQFDVSPATRDRIFVLAQALDYFHGDFEFRKHAVADTGRKIFRYSDGMRQEQTILHWSENKQMQQLTDLFESVALTQSFARRLLYLRRFDKLGLEAVLKRMEEMTKANYLSEMQAIAPVLRQVANDPNVMHVARERANRMLDRLAAATLPTTPGAVPAEK